MTLELSTASVLIVVFIIHTIITHLLNWATRSEWKQYQQQGSLWLHIIEVGLLIWWLTYTF
jgi:uncharacterized membrane protein